MSPIIEILAEGPATSSEIAALLMRPVRNINARLQHMKRRGRVINTYRKVAPIDKCRGRYPYIWELA